MREKSEKKRENREKGRWREGRRGKKESNLSIKLFSRSKHGAFLGGQGESVIKSSSLRVVELPSESRFLSPYRGV